MALNPSCNVYYSLCLSHRIGEEDKDASLYENGTHRTFIEQYLHFQSKPLMIF